MTASAHGSGAARGDREAAVRTPPHSRAIHVCQALIGALILAATAALHAADSLSLSIASIQRDGWTAQGLRLTYKLRPSGTPSSAELTLQQLTAPGGAVVLSEVRATCQNLQPDAETITCRAPSATAVVPRLGQRTFTFEVNYHRPTAAIDLHLAELALAGGEIALQGNWADGDWQLSINAADIDITAAMATAGVLLPKGMSLQGALDAQVSAAGRLARPGTVTGAVDWKEVGFADATGLRAAEKLSGRLHWRARLDADSRAAMQVEADLAAGQLYVDPVFVDFGAHPLSLRTDAVVPADRQAVDVLEFDVEQTGLFSAGGDATLNPTALARPDIHVERFSVSLPGAYASYAKPLLTGTTAGDLRMDGALGGNLEIAAGRLASIDLGLGNVTLTDPQGSLALDGVAGRLSWRAADQAAPPISELGWGAGRIHGVDLGPAALALELHGDNLRLTRSTHLPMLDGALVIHRLTLRDMAGKRRSAEFDAEVEPISLGPLSRALGWQELAGKISGELPSLTYSDGVATLGGRFTASAFGGRIAIDEFRLGDPFSNLPELTADIRLTGLNLETLTQTFDFGRITGRLDGRIEQLRMLGWEPTAFKAWFNTPANDDSAHVISQRAVENLASVGGSGSAAALSSGLLSVFDTFDYDRIGIGCLLKDNVCLMRGLAPKGDGYYIVRGSGLPRIDVVGYVKAVSWPTLIEQIRSATEAGAPVVE